MNRSDEIILKKISSEIHLAISFLDKISQTTFFEDEILKRACCMSIINIGELIKHLSDEIRQEYKHIPWKAIAGFRDIAAHKYQTLRMGDVYVTITTELPVLQEQIQVILENK